MRRMIAKLALASLLSAFSYLEDEMHFVIMSESENVMAPACMINT